MTRGILKSWRIWQCWTCKASTDSSTAIESEGREWRGSSLLSSRGKSFALWMMKGDVAHHKHQSCQVTKGQSTFATWWTLDIDSQDCFHWYECHTRKRFHNWSLALDTDVFLFRSLFASTCSGLPVSLLHLELDSWINPYATSLGVEWETSEVNECHCVTLNH